MVPLCRLIRRSQLGLLRPLKSQYRCILTLAIETSCDDTSVAILEKNKHNKATLHFHSKVTADNRKFQGIHPVVALESHQSSLAKLITKALQSLPAQRPAIAHLGNSLLVAGEDGVQPRKKPDFVTVTRGPGMRAPLAAGLDTAKGLAVGWQVPLLGVHHMQAHALTPRLVSALKDETEILEPEFPFLTLLVSGGHTMLVYSKALCDHKILANTSDLAIGDLVDKCARDILPSHVLEAGATVMYGPLLERFAFPNGPEDYNYTAPTSRKEDLEVKETGYDWAITPPLAFVKRGRKTDSMEYSFSGVGSAVKRVIEAKPDIADEERRVLARETMRVAFEHIISRLLFGLQSEDSQSINTVVVSGGVASNQYLKHMLRTILDNRGFEHVRVSVPPPSLCTDNAAMIAWTGMEMWDAGWRSSLECLARSKWALDPEAEDGGILGVDGWTNIEPQRV